MNIDFNFIMVKTIYFSGYGEDIIILIIMALFSGHATSQFYFGEGFAQSTYIGEDPYSEDSTTFLYCDDHYNIMTITVYCCQIETCSPHEH